MVQPVPVLSAPWLPSRGAFWGPGHPPWPASPSRQARASACRRWRRGTQPYQVWRAGLRLGSVIVQVQIDQDFGGSPYSAGHFPYRQLSKSGGRGDRDKGRGPLAPREKPPTGWMWDRAPRPHAHSTRQPWRGETSWESSAQAFWTWGKGEK